MTYPIFAAALLLGCSDIAAPPRPSAVPLTVSRGEQFSEGNEEPIASEEPVAGVWQFVDEQSNRFTLVVLSTVAELFFNGEFALRMSGEEVDAADMVVIEKFPEFMPEILWPDNPIAVSTPFGGSDGDVVAMASAPCEKERAELNGAVAEVSAALLRITYLVGKKRVPTWPELQGYLAALTKYGEKFTAYTECMAEWRKNNPGGGSGTKPPGPTLPPPKPQA